MASYSKRESVLEHTEQTWTVDADGLHVAHSGQESLDISFAAIRRLRLAFAPTRLKPNRYTCTVFTRDGVMFVIDNMHFRGFGDFEDRSDSYRAIVTELLAGIAAERPEFVKAGSYWLMLAFLLCVLPALAAILLWRATIYLRQAVADGGDQSSPSWRSS